VGDDAPAQDRRDQHSKHHWHQHETGDGRAHSLDDLQVDREEGDRPEKRKTDDQADAAGDDEVSVAKEAHRQDRLAGMPFERDECCGADDAHADQAQDDGRGPGEAYAAETGEQDGGGERQGEQASAGVVDLMPAVRARRGQRYGNHEKGKQAGGQVDVEYPAPCQVIDKKPAEQRANDGGKTERGSEQALIAPAFARGNEIPDYGDGGDDQPAAADPLQCPKQNELEHALRQSAKGGAEQEDYDGRLQHDLAAMDVAELAVERASYGAGQQVGRHHPGQMRESAEFADNGRKCCRHDGLIERGEQQCQKERAENRA
jgi:hypothetical protein